MTIAITPGKIVYCQKWTDGYSIHRNHVDAKLYSLQEEKEAAELMTDFADSGGVTTISATQGTPFLTKIDVTDCNDNLLGPLGRHNHGLRRFDQCPTRLLPPLRLEL